MRSLTGRFSNAVRSIVLVTSDEVVCTIGDSPATVTVSWTFDSFSEKLSTTRWPALNSILERISVAKPGISTFSVYLPSGGSAVTTNRPPCVGGGCARQAGGDVLDRDGRARQDRLLRVDHDAFNVEGRFLGQRRLRDQ